MAKLFIFLFSIMMFLIGISIFVFWIYSIIDLVRSEFKHSSDKITWALLLVLVPLIGLILYWMIGRDQRIDSNPTIQEDEFV